MTRGKRIADPVHGTIELTDVESRVISTPAFQRLRGVKHLGLASLVFPGADYSRFSHGVGTAHVTGEIFRHLRSNSGLGEDDLSADEEQLYRMAALLHDVGHYPYSHTLERALKDYYVTSSVLQPASGSAGSEVQVSAADSSSASMWLHEELGAHVIVESEDIASILASEGIDPDQLSQIITRAQPPKFANLISSDLDADRIDYLMRTALHTGLPYGSIDLDYLLSQMRLDVQRRICFSPKGMRAAEHLLIGRYFDYQQVSYHKTVQGLELMLNDAIGSLLRNELLDCTPAGMQQMLADGTWSSFDDARVLGLLRELVLVDGLPDRDARVVRALLNRRPPRLVLDREILGDDDDAATFRSVARLVREKLSGWESRFGVPFWTWQQNGTRLTKIGSTVPVSAMTETEADSYDYLQQAVRILDLTSNDSSPIQESKRSLIRILAEKALFGVRVYALVPDDGTVDGEEIQRCINEELFDFLT